MKAFWAETADKDKGMFRIDPLESKGKSVALPYLGDLLLMFPPSTSKRPIYSDNRYRALCPRIRQGFLTFGATEKEETIPLQKVRAWYNPVWVHELLLNISALYCFLWDRKWIHPCVFFPASRRWSNKFCLFLMGYLRRSSKNMFIVFLRDPHIGLQKKLWSRWSRWKEGDWENNKDFLFTFRSDIIVCITVPGFQPGVCFQSRGLFTVRFGMAIPPNKLVECFVRSLKKPIVQGERVICMKEIPTWGEPEESIHNR